MVDVDGAMPSEERLRLKAPSSLLAGVLARRLNGLRDGVPSQNPTLLGSRSAQTMPSGKEAQAETTRVWGPRLRARGTAGIFREQGIVFAVTVDKVKPKEDVDKSWAPESWLVVHAATGRCDLRVLTEAEFGQRYKERRDAKGARDSLIQEALPAGRRVSLGCSTPLTPALLDDLRAEGFEAFEPREDFLVWAAQLSEDEVNCEFPNGVMQGPSGEVPILPGDFLVLPRVGGEVSRVPRKIFLETYVKAEEQTRNN